MSNKAASFDLKPTTTGGHLLRWAALIILLLVGLGLRLVDLRDPPFDFHPTRQLRAAIIARGMYYDMLPSADLAVRENAMALQNRLVEYEPQIFERLTALTYRAVGGEHLWIARVYAIIFWWLGGLALFDLTRRLVSWDGGLIALAYYLLLPLAVQASRSFQPDPLVTLWILLTLWTAYRWNKTRTWHWSIATGLVAGITLLVKVTAVFFVAPAVILMVLDCWDLRQAIKRWDVWIAAILAMLIPAAYYIPHIAQDSSGYIEFWNSSFRTMWLEGSFYVQWLQLLDRLFNLALLVVAMIGVALLPEKGMRKAFLGMWIGYLAYGLCFPFQIRSHEYYSLMFVPVVALSLAPVGNHLVRALRVQPWFWRLVASAAVLVGVAFPVWITYTGLIGVNYSGEAAAWRSMGEELPQDGQIVALIHDYGVRLGYYGQRAVELWPGTDDLRMLSQRGREDSDQSSDFETLWATNTAGMDYFLVTRFDQLEAQPLLKERLHGQYPIEIQGNGYILFNLKP